MGRPHDAYYQLLTTAPSHFSGNITWFTIGLDTIMSSAIFIKFRSGFPYFARWTIFPIIGDSGFLGKKLMNFCHTLTSLFSTTHSLFWSPALTNSLRQRWSLCISAFPVHIFQVSFLGGLKKVFRIHTQLIIAFVTDRIFTPWNTMNGKIHSTVSISIFPIRQPGVSIARSADCSLPFPASIWQFCRMRFETVKKFLIFHSFIITKSGSIVKTLPGGICRPHMIGGE